MMNKDIKAGTHILIYYKTYTFSVTRFDVSYGTVSFIYVQIIWGTMVGNMLSIAPERYTAGFCMVKNVILRCI